jgi:hypothetical protein
MMLTIWKTAHPVPTTVITRFQNPPAMSDLQCYQTCDAAHQNLPPKKFGGGEFPGVTHQNCKPGLARGHAATSPTAFSEISLERSSLVARNVPRTAIRSEKNSKFCGRPREIRSLPETRDRATKDWSVFTLGNCNYCRAASTELPCQN